MSSAFEVLVKYGEDQGIEAERISSILLNGLEKEEPLVTFAIGNGGRQAPEVAAARPVLPRTWSMSRSQKSRENGGGWNSSHEVISMKLPVRCWTFSLRSTPVVIALLNWLVMWLIQVFKSGDPAWWLPVMVNSAPTRGHKPAEWFVASPAMVFGSQGPSAVREVGV